MRPLSFTKNIGGLENVYIAIRRGYTPGVTIEQFRRRCGLGQGRQLIITEFVFSTRVQNGKEYVLADTLIEQTMARARFDIVLARLYFFAMNLGMPGERLKPEHRGAGELQRYVVGQHLYVDGAWRFERADKDSQLEPFVRRTADFPSRRKWVNNYWYFLDQCNFVVRPDGTFETFADTWGYLALAVFFERYSDLTGSLDRDALVRAAYRENVHELLGVPASWLAGRAEGAVDFFLTREIQSTIFKGETQAERRAAQRGEPPPRPKAGTHAGRRLSLQNRIERRGENREYLHRLYLGACQLSGAVLRMPDGGFSVDCAHIRPLGDPHRGTDDVGNMLSLSPTMHRLFDRGCIHINPTNFSVRLLHDNAHDHLPTLFVREGHGVSAEQISYFNRNVLRL